MQGYLNPLYAQSFSEIGEPIFLPNAKGWLIKRQIPGTANFDAMGPYPLFFCEDWGALKGDLEKLSEELISISMVIDPFAKYPVPEYKQYFDRFFPYKDHYYLDMSIPFTESISKFSRRDARRALKDVSVDMVACPNISLDEWVFLYDHLIKRHQIKGIRMFSRTSFEKQLSIPGTLFFRAWHNQDLVGGNLYYVQDDVAYGHLLALTDEGYQFGATHAIQWVALHYFQNLVKYVNFGGGTAGNQVGLSGLDKLKLSWTNRIGSSYFCGKILNPKRYQELILNVDPSQMNWFPAYRFGDY